MMRCFRLILLLLPVACAFGDELQFTAEVDRTTVGLGERFVLTVKVSGSGMGSVPGPQLPVLDDFDQLGSSSSQSTNISFVNGRVSREQTISFIYYLAAMRLGELTIGPCKLNYKGSIYQTQAITINVVKGSQTTRPQQRQNPSSPFVTQPHGRVQDEVALGATADRTTVYQGEQVTVSYTFYTRLQIADLRMSDVPAFSGFWAEGLYEAKELEYHTQRFRGKQYNAALIKRVALFPTRSGKLKIGVMKLGGSVVRRGGFFFNTTEPFEVSSSPIIVNVRPLPDSGRPGSFCGGVGRFALSASLDRDSSIGGQPLNLTVEVSGTGNIQLIGQPKVPSLSGVKILSPGTKDRIIRTSGKVKGTRKFIFPLLPQADGRYYVPGIEMGFFSPGEKGYYTLATPRLEFIASGAGKGVREDGNRTGVKVLGSDIIHIKPSQTKLVDAGLGTIPWWGWLFYPAGAVVLCFGIVLGRHRRKLEQDRGYARRMRSNRLVKKRLAQAAKVLAQNKETEFYAALDRAVLGYVGDRFNIETFGMTGDELRYELGKKQVPEDIVESLLELIQNCDAARFSPGMTKHSAQETFKRARRVLERL
ncbi:hypothetical protein CH330_00085 [candidate division WOR-3 bacterium JGI_Cruoil_03_51_56]|uniref:Protein BatD n=1 Tax=candidate division WOR-3 bacterium JGI_Cruoil_03_51_56 TaxID=1973747 RepID=A0A235BYK8_UNCW3|nr:MAG: hypothetical protein CH330_00085 [candidate division WOR-3 bacterium JGI_Cruoil_03_51_56]